MAKYCKLASLLIVVFIGLCFSGIIEGLECYNSRCSSKGEPGKCTNTTVSKATSLVSCDGSCQINYIQNKDAEVLKRACVLSCQPSVIESSDGSLAINSCCQDNLCNTDLSAMTAINPGGSRCYECVGSRQDGIQCGEQATTSTNYGFAHIKTCEHGCLLEYQRTGNTRKYTRRCLNEEEICMDSHVTSEETEDVKQCCTKDLCNDKITDENDDSDDDTNSNANIEHVSRKCWLLAFLAMVVNGIVQLDN